MRPFAGDPLWAVTGWHTEPNRDSGGGCPITLWASPRFLVAAVEAIDPERFQKSVDYTITQAFGPGPHMSHHAHWHDRLLVGWRVPGSCACIGIDFGLPNDWRERGVEYTSHNLDTSLQQATIMAIWMVYALGVEATIGMEERT